MSRSFNTVAILALLASVGCGGGGGGNSAPSAPAPVPAAQGPTARPATAPPTAPPTVAPAAVSIQEYGGLTAGAKPWDIVSNPQDGNLWFTELGVNKIGVFSPTQKAVLHEYTIRSGGPIAAPHGIAIGPDGAVWFTESAADRIGRIDASGNVTEFTVPTSNAAPWSLAAGPDHNLWFTEYAGGKIGKVDVAGGTFFVSDYAVGPPPAGCNPAIPCPTPRFIVTGPDGNLWFTEFNGNAIAAISPTTGAVVATQALNSDPTDLTAPEGIATDNRSLWIALSDANPARVASFVPATASVIDYKGVTVQGEPTEIVIGADRSVWFTENGNTAGEVFAPAALGHIPVGATAVSEFKLPSATSQPQGITVGSDGAIWFTEPATNMIGRAQ